MNQRSIFVLIFLVMMCFVEQLGAEISVEKKVNSKNLNRIERNISAYTPLNAGLGQIEIGNLIVRELGRSSLENPDDGTPIDLLEFSGTKGDVITVSVKSDDFDPVIWLIETEYFLFIQGDDDSGTDSDAEFKTVLPRSGDYVLVVNSYGDFGSYSVRIKKEPALLFPSGSLGSKKRAVLIGINDYPGVQADLRASVYDVDAVHEFLITKANFDPMDILVIKDVYATYENILGGIQSFLGSVPADGTVVIYYSGHGVQLSTRDGTEQDLKNEAFYLSDGSYFLDDELRGLVDCLDAGKVSIIVDSCYSGGIHRGIGKKNVVEGGVKKYIELAEPGRQELNACQKNNGYVEKSVNLVIAASQEYEEAWEWDDWEDIFTPQSVFTYFLIEALLGAFDSPSKILLDSMVEEVSNKTTAFTEEFHSATQEARIVNFSKHIPNVDEIFGVQ